MISIISDKTITKTHVKSILSNLVHVSGLKMIERHLIGVVERFPHEQPETGPDSRFRGSNRRGSSCVPVSTAGTQD